MAAVVYLNTHRPPIQTSSQPSAPPPYIQEGRGVPEGGVAPLVRFREIAGRYEIRPDFCAKLRQLEDYEIIVIADDSGSMNTRVTVPSPGSTTIGSATATAFAPSRTRWTELLEFCGIVSEIATVMDKDGIDIYFLNRPPIMNVTHPANPHFQTAFLMPPAGTTPLVSTLQNVIQTRCRTSERKVLIIIATDGSPDGGPVGIQEFIKTIKYRPKNTFVSILACTDEDDAISYLNKIDRMVPGVDVVDDYYSELKEVKQEQGHSYPFSYGDYVVKVLLGSIDSTMDRLDEKNSCKECCCSVS